MELHVVSPTRPTAQATPAKGPAPRARPSARPVEVVDRDEMKQEAKQEPPEWEERVAQAATRVAEVEVELQEAQS